MKNINDFINEQRSGKNSKPKTKKELLAIIEERISKEGEKCDLNDIDVSNITNMAYLFEDSVFNGDISKWDVSNVTTMQGMFAECDFDGDISSWDVSNVKNMASMFAYSVFYNNISQWNVLNVKNYKDIFINCPLEYKKTMQPKFK